MMKPIATATECRTYLRKEMLKSIFKLIRARRMGNGPCCSLVNRYEGELSGLMMSAAYCCAITDGEFNSINKLCAGGGLRPQMQLRAQRQQERLHELAAEADRVYGAGASADRIEPALTSYSLPPVEVLRGALCGAR